MDTDLLLTLDAIANAKGGYFTRDDLRLLCIDPDAVAQLLRAGHVRKVRYGAYAVARRYDPLSADEKYRARCWAVADKLAPRAVLCGLSSLAVQHKPLVGFDLTDVHVVRLDGKTGRKQAGVTHRSFPVTEADLVQVDGRLVTSEARAIWEAGVRGHPRSTLVLMDHALHSETVSHEALARTGEEFAAWEGSGAPRIAMSLADHRSESPGESVARWMFHAYSLPMPELQYVVADADGVALGRSDYVWEDYRTLGEFDGKVKYGRGFVEGKEPEDVVEDERTRERAMCQQRFGMLRFLWRDVWSPSPAEVAWVRGELEANRRKYL